MRFTAEIAPLRAAVEAAFRAVDSRGYIPVLSHLHVSVADGWAKITGTNMNLYVAARAEAAVPEAGDVNIPAAPLRAFLASCPAGALVEAASDDDGITIKAGRGSVYLKTSDEAFPSVKSVEANTEIAAISAIKALSAFCAGDDSARTHLAGVIVCKDGLFASNTFVGMAHIGGGGASAHIPADAAPFIAAADRLFVGDAWWRTESENVRCYGKLFEVMPNDAFWGVLSANDGECEGFVDADAWLAALAMVTPVDSGRQSLSRGMVCEVGGGQIKMSIAGNYGSGETVVDFDGDGERRFVCDPAILRKILTSASGRVLRFCVKSDKAAETGMIKLSDGDMVWTLLPMRG